MGFGAEGVIFPSPPPCRSQGRQTGKSILSLGTVHYKGLPHDAICQSVPQAGWELLTRKVSGHTDHTVSERLKSCSAPRTAPDRRRQRAQGEMLDFFFSPFKHILIEFQHDISECTAGTTIILTYYGFYRD